MLFFWKKNTIKCIRNINRGFFIKERIPSKCMQI